MHKSFKGNKSKVPKITEAQYEEYIQSLKGENISPQRIEERKNGINATSVPKQQ